MVQFVRSPAKVFMESRRGCRNTRPRHDHRRRAGEPQRESNKEIFLLIYRYNCTKSKIFAKKLKKVWKFNFLPYLCSRNQTTNKNMKKIIITRASRKHQKDVGKMRYNIALALSKFTAIMVGKPDKYKTTDGCINYYPSDCLDGWSYSTIDNNGQIINDPMSQPEDVAGIICKGRYWNDEPQQITVMFKDI